MKNRFLVKTLVYFCVFFLSAFTLSAQLGLDKLDEESFFIGGLSPNVLTQGNVEVNFYSALFSNWIALHESAIASPIKDRWRFTDFTTNLEAYTGITTSGRWDIGLRLKYTRARLDNAASSSPFRVLQNKSEEAANVDVDKTYDGFKEIGLRLRLVPFEGVPALTINGGFSFSPIKDDEVSRNLQADRNSLDLNIAYYVSLNNNSYYYFIANGIAFSPSSLDEDEDKDGLIDRIVDDKWRYNTSGSFFIVQLFANRKIALYPGISYAIGFKKPSRGDKNLIRTDQQILGILGLQFQPSSNLSINVSTAVPFLLENSNTLYENVRESYSFLSLGGRFLF